MIEEILKQRESQYGKFSDNARITQQLKSVMRNAPRWDQLSDTTKEAYEMVAHKIARHLCGDGDHTDTVTDEIGYLTRALEEMKKELTP